MSQIIRGSPRQGRRLTSRNLTFAVPRAGNEDEWGIKYTCDDLENQRNCDGDPHVDLIHPVPESQAEISTGIEQWFCETNFLNKLRAVHLHVLASEQWNASRLALCHR